MILTRRLSSLPIQEVSISLFDLHTHILPEVDDGAESFEDAFATIDLMIKNDVKGVCLTPHQSWEKSNDFEKRILPAYGDFKTKISNVFPDFEMKLGAEIMCDADALQKPFCIEGTRFFITEFSPFTMITKAALEIIFDAQLKGFKPVIAHIERYRETENINEVKEWLNRGFILSINAESIINYDSKTSLAWELLTSGFIHIVASDTHGMRKKRPLLFEAYRFISKEWNRKTADLLCCENPRMVTDGELPVLPEAKEKKNWFQKIIKGNR